MDRCNVGSTVCAVSLRSGEEGAEPEREALDLPGHLQHVPTLTYSHELWVMTERRRSQVPALETG